MTITADNIWALFATAFGAWLVLIGAGAGLYFVFNEPGVMTHHRDADRAANVRIADVTHRPGHYPALHTYHDSRQITYAASPALPAPLNVPQLAAPPVPTFAALLAQDTFGPGKPLLLGYTAAGALLGGWGDLYSSAVAGLSGSGKTTTLRFLAGQSALQGARFLLLDPHAHAGEDSLAGTLAPLAGAFLAPPADTPPAMLRLLEQATALLQARLAGAPKPWPLIVAIDEFTSLMGRSDLADPLARLIEATAQEGRKVGVFALVSGQIWTATRAGGTELRDALASTYVHRMKRNQALRLLPSDAARQAEGLAVGTALLYRTSGDIETVQIPQTTGADMIAVGARLTGPIETTARPVPVADSSHVADVATPPTEGQRAAALWLHGYNWAQVVKEVRGIESSQGGSYQKALNDVQAAARAAMQEAGLSAPRTWEAA